MSSSMIFAEPRRCARPIYNSLGFASINCGRQVRAACDSTMSVYRKAEIEKRRIRSGGSLSLGWATQSELFGPNSLFSTDLITFFFRRGAGRHGHPCGRPSWRRLVGSASKTGRRNAASLPSVARSLIPLRSLRNVSDFAAFFCSNRCGSVYHGGACASSYEVGRGKPTEIPTKSVPDR